MRDRALSTVVGYALLLVVVGLVTAGVLLGTTGYVDDRRTTVTATELRVVGNELAADLTAVDTLASTVSADGTISLESELVDRVAGYTYLIEVAEADPPNTYDLILTSGRTSVSVAVTVRTEHPVTTGRIAGGDVTVGYRNGTLEVDRA